MMELTSIDTIYNDIMLLSDSDRFKLYNRMKKEYYNNSEIVALTTDGKSLTLEQYRSRVHTGIEQCLEGKSISLEDLSLELGYNYEEL